MLHRQVLVWRRRGPYVAGLAAQARHNALQLQRCFIIRRINQTLPGQAQGMVMLAETFQRAHLTYPGFRGVAGGIACQRAGGLLVPFEGLPESA